MNHVILTQQLLHRARTDGSAPLLTHYAPGGARTELSARSLANWVDKTANLLVTEHDPGDRVRLDVAAAHPGHWMTMVWVLACWRAGLVVTDGAADVVVGGPMEPGTDAADATWSCSLHPLALPQRDLPAGVRDFSAEALAQPDAWLGMDPLPSDDALDLGGSTASHTELAGGHGVGGRVLVADPADLRTAIDQLLVGPLLGGGTRVVTEGLDADENARVAETERATR